MNISQFEVKLESLVAELSEDSFIPACGSGNFLIIAYKELCKLEIQIFKRLYCDQTTFPFSKIQLTQFYGIEIAADGLGRANTSRPARIPM